MLAIFNDTHLDPKRVGGTTLASRDALQWYALEQFRNLLSLSEGSDNLVVLGDIFNSNKVEDWIKYQVAMALREFHEKSPDTEIWLVRGNHDSRSEKKQDMCALEFLYLLTMDFTNLVFEGPVDVWDEDQCFRIIPHMFDQTAFDTAIETTIADAKVGQIDYLLVHVNIDNKFAVGDHSLNLSRKQAKELDKVGVHVISAHEHQWRQPFKNVTVIGNQFPTSVADCLGNDFKYMLRIAAGEIEPVRTWSATDDFVVTKIDGIAAIDPRAKFIRFEGTMEPNEFSEAIREITAFRKEHDAFVISSAIKVVRPDKQIDVQEITKVNVMALLAEAIDPKYKERLVECIQSADSE